MQECGLTAQKSGNRELAGNMAAVAATCVWLQRPFVGFPTECTQAEQKILQLTVIKHEPSGHITGVQDTLGTLNNNVDRSAPALAEAQTPKPKTYFRKEVLKPERYLGGQARAYEPETCKAQI